MNGEITFRGGYPAVNVKDEETYHSANEKMKALIDALPNEIGQARYESVREDFWSNVAPALAEEAGYGEVYSEGRSDGWLMVEKPPNLDPDEPGFRQRSAEWLRFEDEIGLAILSLREDFHERLEEALTEHEATQRRIATTRALTGQGLMLDVKQLVERNEIPRAELERLLNTYGPAIGGD
jgi:hypothetical protein